MTKYWEKVLEEVLNKNDPNREFIYTHRQKPQNHTQKKKNNPSCVKEEMYFRLASIFQTFISQCEKRSVCAVL